MDTIKDLVISGDSFVEGIGDTEKRGWANRLSKCVFPVVTHIYGFGGDTILDLKLRYLKEIDTINESSLIIQIGINDSRIRPSRRYSNEVNLIIFKKELYGILNYCTTQRKLRNIYIIGLSLVDEKLTNPYKEDKIYINDQILRYDHVIEDLANFTKSKYVSLKKIINPSTNTLYDGLHPNSNGHEKIKSIILDFLKKYGDINASRDI